MARDTKKLKSKVKTLHKKGLNDKQIGKRLHVSDSYVWVIRHNYKG